jgi:hypothetical protein
VLKINSEAFFYLLMMCTQKIINNYLSIMHS